MDAETSRDEIVAIAIQSELEAALFYRMLSELTSRPEVKAALLALAGEEEFHAEKLIQLHKALTGSQRAPHRRARAEGDPNLMDFHSCSLAEVIRFALTNELEAIRVYEALAAEIGDPEAAMMLGALAASERGHADYLRSQLQRVEGDPGLVVADW